MRRIFEFPSLSPKLNFIALFFKTTRYFILLFLPSYPLYFPSNSPISVEFLPINSDLHSVV